MMRRWLCCWLGLAWIVSAQAAVSVRDGQGTVVTLPRPAQRVAALVPHSVETLYAIGAGGQLVATVSYADYPPAARKLPMVGSYSGVSLDAILRQRPDLVVVWSEGGLDKQIQRLRQLGIPVYVSRPLQLDDVAREMLALGTLTGHDAGAKKAAAQYRAELQRLNKDYGQRKPVSVFIQVNQNPLYTVSGSSFLGQVVTLCGGRNVFGNLKIAAPQVSTESVVRANPQAILSTGITMKLTEWSRWRSIPAVAVNARYILPRDIVSRPGPRLPQGARVLCQSLDDARRKLGLSGR